MKSDTKANKQSNRQFKGNAENEFMKDLEEIITIHGERREKCVHESRTGCHVSIKEHYKNKRMRIRA